MLTKIFYNGKIRTMDSENTVCQAIGISGNLIQAVGTDEAILAMAGPETEKTDLEGKLMLPGFFDCHMHVMLSGSQERKIDFSEAKSIEELVRIGKKYMEKHKPEAQEWILAGGFDQNQFAVPEIPDRTVLDQITEENPLITYRVCYHIAIVNSRALEVLKESGKEFPKEAEKDADGNYTGRFYESAVIWLEKAKPAMEIREIQNDIMAAAENMAACGLTEAHSNDCENGMDVRGILEAYRRLAAEGRLPVRVREEISFTDPEELKAFLQTKKEWFADPFFQILNIKIIADGALGVRTAWLREAYEDDPDNRGMGYFTQEQMNALIRTAHQGDMQAAVHAIGDGTLDQVVQAMELAQKEEKKDLRHRIVHCQFGDMELYRRMKDADIAADIQPPFVPSDYKIAETCAGEKRCRESYAWKTLRDMGILTGGGSDSPVETFDPLWGIYCAVTRKDAEGLPKGGWYPRQCLSVEEAVRLYTSDAAYLSFEEERKGTLETGKWADLVVLSKDIFHVDAEEIKNTKVDMTMVDGRIVFERKENRI